MMIDDSDNKQRTCFGINYASCHAAVDATDNKNVDVERERKTVEQKRRKKNSSKKKHK